MSTYDSENKEFIAAVHEGLVDIAAGRVYTAEEVIASLTKRYQE